MKNSQEQLFRINGDVMSILKSGNDIGWQSINSLTINRVVYLSGVLYSFKFPAIKNPFATDYSFEVNYKGPHDERIIDSLIFLDSREYIIRNDQGEYSINPETELAEADSDEVKRAEWMKIIMYILVLHGFDKIYEFVIRDPEYQDSIEGQRIKPLKLTKDNSTIEFLNRFKSDFERALDKESSELSSQKYLELYFEYIFSRIAKGELDL